MTHETMIAPKCYIFWEQGPAQPSRLILSCIRTCLQETMSLMPSRLKISKKETGIRDKNNSRLTDKRYGGEDSRERGWNEDDVDPEDGVSEPSVETVEDGHLESGQENGADRGFEIPRRDDRTGKRRDPSNRLVIWRERERSSRVRAFLVSPRIYVACRYLFL